MKDPIIHSTFNCMIDSGDKLIIDGDKESVDFRFELDPNNISEITLDRNAVNQLIMKLTDWLNKDAPKDLDELWEINKGKPFCVVRTDDIFNTRRQVTGRVENSVEFDNGTYWVSDRLIRREDCLDKKWVQI